MSPLPRWLLFLALGLALLPTQGSGVTPGKPVTLYWTYTASIPSGMTVTSFVIQRCRPTPDCFTGCTPLDFATVTPATFVVAVPYSDTNVEPGASYRHQVLAVGTVNGTAARSDPSNQLCTYVVSQKRGSPTPIAP